MKFIIDIDEFCGDVFHELETHSVGCRSHECEREAIDIEHAAESLANALMPFIKDQFTHRPS